MTYPLMENNIEKEDIDALIDFLKTSDRFTNGPKVREFESAWSSWLGGVKHSLFVNSGSSANFITMAAIKELYGEGEVIVSPIGWESDIASVIQAGLKPVFVDVRLDNMAMDTKEVLAHITGKTKAVMLTHVLGFDGISDELLKALEGSNIKLIEDTCESHGATHTNSIGEEKKCGSYGFASNFSFYYAHHMSTIEGGMICTDDDEFYQYCRMFRSHGMLREADDLELRALWERRYPNVHREFLFTVPGYNFRSTELNAVVGLNQLKRLDKNIEKRRTNFEVFISHLDSNRFYTDFHMTGNSNYAFVVILREKDGSLFKRITDELDESGVEYRRGTAGGGNQVRQPYVQRYVQDVKPDGFPVSEHIHEYGLYIGNYPQLERQKILDVCEILNNA